MRDNPGDVPPAVDWPEGLDPTPPEERTTKDAFQTGSGKSKRQIGEELEKHVEADQWFISDSTGSHRWPGIVVHWRKDGTDYALVSDAYTTKKANARAAYWWIHETRMREQRPVTTAQDAFAAAALPSGQPVADDAETDGPIPLPSALEPHEVLRIDADAHPETVEAAYRRRVQQTHPDKPGGSKAAFKRVKRAYETLTDSDV